MILLPPFHWLFAIVVLCLTAGVGSAQPGGVVIHEIVADNRSGLRDEDGAASDWLELHNPTMAAVSLAGAALTDSPAVPSKWPLPALLLPPQGYLVIFASGKDRRDPAGTLHTNFSLSKDGEYLALTWQEEVVSGFVPAFPAQVEDVSYGYRTSGGSELVFMTQPTPGAANQLVSTVSGAVAIAPPGGTFAAPFAVTLTPVRAGDVIHYTLDGTLPDAASPIYTGPISITVSTRLRTVARAQGFTGAVTGVSYVRLAPDIVGYTSPLPLMVLENFNGGPVPAKGLSSQQVAEQPAVWMLHERRGSSAVLSGTPQLSGDIGIRGRGHFSSTWSKKAYAVECRAPDGSSTDAAPLDLPANDDWVLYYPDPAEFRDPTMIANTFIYELSRRLGRYAPRFRFVEVFLNTNGGDLSLTDRQGVYVLIEKISRGPQRLPFSSLSPDGTRGGALLSIDRPDAIPETGFPTQNGATAPQFFRTAGPDRISQTAPNDLTLSGDDLPGNSSAVVNFQQPGGYRILPAQRTALETWFRGFEDALYHPVDWRDPAVGWRRWLVEEDWAQGYLLQNFTRHFDALRLSVHPWLGDDRKLRLGPIWDVTPDSYHGQDPPDHSLYYRSGQLWFPRLFADADFKQTYIDQWTRWRRTGFSDAAMEAVIDAQAAEITAAKAVAQGIPDAASWNSKLTVMKSWVKGRAAYFDSSFVPLPVISPPGGIVTPGSVVAVGSTGTGCWVTTDGTDPRLPGGAVSPSALPAGDLTISGDVRITARSRNGIDWSGPATVVFAVNAVPASMGNPMISEIHYHPAAANSGEVAAGFLDREDFEFIELHNRASAKVSLHDVRLILDRKLYEPAWEGISADRWTIPAGGRLVLVRNRVAFARRYGPAVLPGGVLTGSLSNASQSLFLEKSDGTAIGAVTYDPANPWPPAADGAGYSLTLREGGQPELAEGWRSSVSIHGSPGSSDALAYTGLDDAAWQVYSLGQAAPLEMTPPGPGQRISLRVPRGADRARYTLEQSADLRHWQPAAVAPPLESRTAAGEVVMSWPFFKVPDHPFRRVRAAAVP